MFHVLSLIIPLAVLLPNLGFFGTKPSNVMEADAHSGNAKYLETFEGIGRISVFALPVFYSISVKTSIEWLALLGMVLMLTLYYCGWIRYFAGNREYQLLFAPILTIPVPLAIAPVLYFLFASVILHSPLLALGAVILGMGHIPMGFGEYQRIKKR